MTVRLYLLFFPLGFLLTCQRPSAAVEIDLDGIDARLLPATLFLDNLSESKGHVDSVTVLSKKLILPFKYENPFIAVFYIVDKRQRVIASSDGFVFSDHRLTTTKTHDLENGRKGESPKPMHLIVKGGENNLYQNRSFMPKPVSWLSGHIRWKLENDIALTKQEIDVSKRWNVYERLILKDVDAQSKCYYTLYKLKNIVPFLTLSTSEKCFDLLDKALQKMPEGELIKEHLNSRRKLTRGKVLPEMPVKDRQNKEIDLVTGLKGKYFFIDFWASWCVPCRQDMQKLKKLYKQVDKDKMEFISISIDQFNHHWIKALDEENLEWPNYVNGQTTFKERYGLNFIPQNIIIDRNGGIVWRNMSMDEIAYFLNEKNLLVNSGYQE